MKTIERVFEILNKEKVELKSEKVELGLIDDVKKLISNLKNAQQIFDDIESVSKEAVKEYTNLQIRKEKVKDTFKTVIDTESQVKTTSKLTDRAFKMLGEINKQAQELGISPTQIKEYNQLNEFFSKMAKGESEAFKYINNIKKLNNKLK